MAIANSLATLNGLFKEVYADKLENIIPDGVKLLKEIKFIGKDKQNGSLYHQPVVLGLEHGCSFSTGGDAFTLNDAIAGATKDAQVQGAQMVLRSVLSYTAASRAIANDGKSFESATKFLVGNMLRSMTRKLEIELLYGAGATPAGLGAGVGYGAVSAVTGTGPYVITMTAASWAPGIWAGAESMVIEFVNSGLTAITGTGTVTAVDMEARTVTVALLTGIAPAATNILFHKGAFGNEFSGIHAILSNTGTLFNISAVTYNLWKGNLYNVGGQLSINHILTAASRAVEKGLDQKVKVFVNPRGWANMITAETSKRQYDGSYKPGELEGGQSSIKLHGQNGEIEVEPSIFIKEGFAYMLVMEELVRIGSSDVTFRRPGQGDEFFRDLEASAGYELRAYTDQAVFSACPGKMVLLSGIVNV